MQIENFILLQQMSLESSDKLYDNLRYDEKLSEDKIIYNISSVGRALKSFFHKKEYLISLLVLIL